MSGFESGGIKRRRGTVVAVLALTAAGCSPSLVCGPGTSMANGTCTANDLCAPGTHDEAGQCVADVSCAKGTHVLAGQCVPDVSCAPGTHARDGLCDPDVTCSNGTHAVNGQCAPDDVCAPGTHDSMGQCIADVQCGTGAHVANGLCVPDDNCGMGTHDAMGHCAPDDTCGAGTYPLMGQCIPDPQFPELTPGSGVTFRSVHLVTITYPLANYGNHQAVQDLGSYVVTSPWYLAVGWDYGVGAGTSEAIDLPGNDLPPKVLTDADLRAYLNRQIQNGLLPAADPMNSAQLVYMIYLPTFVTLTNGNVTLCKEDWGYHQWNRDLNGNPYTYAVIGHCVGLPQIEATAGHELIEAATDPYLDSIKLRPLLFDSWFARNKDEVGDLCNHAPYVKSGNFQFERVWSVSAAHNHHSPCIPGDVSDPPYYNVKAFPANPVLVAAGKSVTFTLTGWAEGPIQNGWTLATEAARVTAFDPGPQLSATTINDGTQVTLTLSVPQGTPSGYIGAVLVKSLLAGHGGLTDRFWPVMVRAM